MVLHSYADVEFSRTQLKYVEELYERARAAPVENPVARELTLLSLGRFINQIKEDILRFECKQRERANATAAQASAMTAGTNGLPCPEAAAPVGVTADH